MRRKAGTGDVLPGVLVKFGRRTPLSAATELFDPTQFAEQILGVDGFGQDFKVVTLGMSTIEQVGGGGLAREQQNFDGWQQRTDANGGLYSVQVGHDDIRDQHVGLEGWREFQRFFAGVDGLGLEAALIEDHSQRICNDPLVVGNKDFWLVRSLVHKLLMNCDAGIGHVELGKCG
jgi:hypothetical protein